VCRSKAPLPIGQLAEGLSFRLAPDLRVSLYRHFQRAMPELLHTFWIRAVLDKARREGPPQGMEVRVLDKVRVPVA